MDAVEFTDPSPGRPLSIVPRQKIVELRAAGMSFGKIASKYNISKTSVVRITKQAP